MGGGNKGKLFIRRQGIPRSPANVPQDPQRRRNRLRSNRTLRAGYAPIVIGNGPTPFLAWVDGYDRLGRTYDRFNATQVSFDLVKDNWQARIAFQAGSNRTIATGTTYLPSGNLYGLSSVGGPILYQQPQRIVVVNGNPANNQVLVLPRGPAPVFVNPFGGGMRMSGVGVSGAGLSTSSRSFSRGGGISVRINR